MLALTRCSESTSFVPSRRPVAQARTHVPLCSHRLLNLWVNLQSGWLRPPVARDAPRPLLIVGSQSSGTVQMAKQLRELGLEIGHETSDSQWDFTRDGTVSWLHGLRFLPGTARNATSDHLCRRFYKRALAESSPPSPPWAAARSAL